MSAFALLARPLLALAVLAAGLPAPAAIAPASPAAALRSEFVANRERLAASPYGWPVVLDSRERDHLLEGEAFAVLDHPFPVVATALAPPSHWCELLLLPFNTKHCEARDGPGPGTLTLYVGRKNETALKDAYRLQFRFAIAERGTEHLKVELRCAQGPLGTRDYRIVLEATPADAGRTFVKLSYSYGYGTLSRVAMHAYLSTLGASKVGFSHEKRDGQGAPRLVRGMRGVMERNTMRYALALDAYLDSLAVAPEARVRHRLDEWFSATERYPRQLREIERADYLAMKEREYARMYARGCCRSASAAIP